VVTEGYADVQLLRSISVVWSPLLSQISKWCRKHIFSEGGNWHFHSFLEKEAWLSFYSNTLEKMFKFSFTFPTVFTDVLCHVHYNDLDNLKKEKECFVWKIFKDYKIYFNFKRKCGYFFETFKIGVKFLYRYWCFSEDILLSHML
jgi:hypothetical protein